MGFSEVLRQERLKGIIMKRRNIPSTSSEDGDPGEKLVCGGGKP